MDGSEIFEDSLLLEKVWEQLCGAKKNSDANNKPPPPKSAESSRPTSAASSSRNSPVVAEEKPQEVQVQVMVIYLSLIW